MNEQVVRPRHRLREFDQKHQDHCHAATKEEESFCKWFWMYIDSALLDQLLFGLVLVVICEELGVEEDHVAGQAAKERVFLICIVLQLSFGQDGLDVLHEQIVLWLDHEDFFLELVEYMLDCHDIG